MNRIKAGSADELTALRQRVQTLEKENTELREDALQTSDLLYEFTRRTLLSSASIQTAVSSMLSENFLWDGSSDREFLEIIDESISFICNQLSLVSMLLRIQSNKADIRFDSYPIDEVLNGMMDSVQKRMKKENIPAENILFKLSESDKLINADYNYINTGLTLFISGLMDFGGPVRVTGTENGLDYELRVENCAESAVKMVRYLLTDGALPEGMSNNHYSNAALKLMVSTKLLQMQNAVITPVLDGSDHMMVTVAMPLLGESAKR